MELAEDVHHLLGLGGLGERGEPSEVTEEGGDLSPVARQDRFTADGRVGELRADETAQAVEALDLGYFLGRPVPPGAR